MVVEFRKVTRKVDKVIYMENARTGVNAENLGGGKAVRAESRRGLEKKLPRPSIAGRKEMELVALQAAEPIEIRTVEYEAQTQGPVVVYFRRVVVRSATRYHIAKETGLSIVTVSRIFNGFRAPSFYSARLIAETIGCTLNDLYDHLAAVHKRNLNAQKVG